MDPVLHSLNAHLRELDRQDSIADLMEVYGADGYEEDGGFLYLYRGGEYLTGFERKR